MTLNQEQSDRITDLLLAKSNLEAEVERLTDGFTAARANSDDYIRKNEVLRAENDRLLAENDRLRAELLSRQGVVVPW